MAKATTPVSSSKSSPPSPPSEEAKALLKQGDNSPSPVLEEEEYEEIEWDEELVLEVAMRVFTQRLCAMESYEKTVAHHAEQSFKAAEEFAKVKALRDKGFA